MSRTISFTIADEDYEIIRHEAKSKGLKPSEFCRMTTFSHINKYPSKGVMSELDRVISVLKLKMASTPIDVGLETKSGGSE
jgi:hypothetical protein